MFFPLQLSRSVLERKLNWNESANVYYAAAVQSRSNESRTSSFGNYQCNNEYSIFINTSFDSSGDSNDTSINEGSGNYEFGYDPEHQDLQQMCDSDASDYAGCDDSSFCASDSSNLSNLSDESNIPLVDGSPISCDEAILRVLKLYVSERWTKTSLDKIIKLIKDLLPAPNSFPKSSVMMFQRLKEVAPFQSDIEHPYCAKCQLYKDNVLQDCVCGCCDTNIFYEYPIGPQLQYFFEHRNLASVIDEYKQNRVQTDGAISDIVDSREYLRLSTNSNQYDLTLVLNLDGLSITETSDKEAWPILSFICEVPPELRSSFMIVSGIYVGDEKPKMNTYLSPFVNSLSRIYLSGGVSWTHPTSKVLFQSQVTCPVLSADAPAKASVLNVKPFNHRFGCNVCEQKTRLIPLTPAQVARNAMLEPRKRIRPLRRFVYEDINIPLRNGPRMEAQGILAEECGKSRKGVLGRTVLTHLPYVDRALCVCAEYLHQVCLGVAKYFMNLMLFVRGPWFIGDKLSELDEFMTSIRVPQFVKRIPRKFSKFKFLIGSEFRSLLL